MRRFIEDLFTIFLRTRFWFILLLRRRSALVDLGQEMNGYFYLANIIQVHSKTIKSSKLINERFSFLWLSCCAVGSYEYVIETKSSTSTMNNQKFRSTVKVELPPDEWRRRSWWGYVRKTKKWSYTRIIPKVHCVGGGRSGSETELVIYSGWPHVPWLDNSLWTDDDPLGCEKWTQLI